MTQPEDVLDASFFITAGDVVPITVMRGNQKTDFQRAGDASTLPVTDSAPLLRPQRRRNVSQAIPLSLGSDVPPTP